MFLQLLTKEIKKERNCLLFYAVSTTLSRIVAVNK